MRSPKYADREILATRVGQRANFEIKNYNVRWYRQVSKDFAMVQLVALDMQELNNPKCNIDHMVINLRVPKHVYHYVKAQLKAKDTIHISAIVKRYKHKNQSHSKRIFDQLESFKNGDQIFEIEPLHTFGLKDARVKLPFDLNFMLNKNKYEEFIDYEGNFMDNVKLHIAFEDKLNWFKENIAYLGSEDQSKLLNWVQKLTCKDLVTPPDEEDLYFE